MVNRYIVELMSLRRDFENRIDNEIEEEMRGRGDSIRLKDSLKYIIENAQVLRRIYNEKGE